MTRKNRNLKGPAGVSNSTLLLPQDRRCFEGEHLARLLKLITREIESARLTDASLPEKFWLKQQFSVGVNDVTRVLERMASIPNMGNSLDCSPGDHSDGKPPSVQLQAILLADDCNPRWLTKHLPSLASSRKVPLIYVKDKKAGSLRLGELVKLKTAMAIGVKAKGNSINKLIEEILHGDVTDFETSDLKCSEIPLAPC